MDRGRVIRTTVEWITLNNAGMNDNDHLAAGAIAETWVDYASGYCRRADFPPEMVSIIRDTAMAAYNRRGDEGAQSSSVGGQSIHYDDLAKTMERRLLAAGLRAYKL